VDDVRWTPTRSDVSQVVRKLESFAREIIKCAECWALEFNTVKTEVALFIRRRAHKKYRHPNRIAKIQVGKGFVRFKKKVTRWLGVWMDTHLTFKEHHNECMKKAMAAEARLRSLTPT
jgi:hypothetical protein